MNKIDRYKLKRDLFNLGISFSIPTDEVLVNRDIFLKACGELFDRIYGAEVHRPFYMDEIVVRFVNNGGKTDIYSNDIVCRFIEED